MDDCRSEYASVYAGCNRLLPSCDFERNEVLFRCQPSWNGVMVATVTDIGSASATVNYFEQVVRALRKAGPEHRRASFRHGAAARALELELARHVSPKRFNKVLL